MSLRNDIMRLSVLGLISDIRIELQAPVLILPPWICETVLLSYFERLHLKLQLAVVVVVVVVVVIFFCPAPWGPREGSNGQMVKYHLISITKSISKMFIRNFLCVLTNERNKTYQTGFLFCCLGHALWGRTWGCLGFKNQILSRRLSVISPPKS